MNEMKELASMKEVPHRDFYNVRKVQQFLFFVRLFIYLFVCLLKSLAKSDQGRQIGRVKKYW